MSGEMTEHGERMSRAHRLSIRERRNWINKLIAAQEVVEKAQEELTALMLKANDSGVSHDVIGGALGMHSTTISGRLARLRDEAAQ